MSRGAVCHFCKWCNANRVSRVCSPSYTAYIYIWHCTNYTKCLFAYADGLSFCACVQCSHFLAMTERACSCSSTMLYIHVCCSYHRNSSTITALNVELHLGLHTECAWTWKLQPSCTNLISRLFLGPKLCMWTQAYCVKGIQNLFSTLNVGYTTPTGGLI